MSERVPLGEKEGPRLEFKGADALKDPEKIAREVVAMLNAQGGKVWVGLREEDGRAVAVEPIADPEREKGRLLNYLVDTIEPAISNSMVNIEVQNQGQGAVLDIVVGPAAAAKPYAFLRKTGRHFVIRVGDRIRPMTREEIFHVADPATGDRLKTSISKVIEERKEVFAKGEALFWMRLEPAVEVSLDIQDPRLEEFLQNPQATGNRDSGWNFSAFQYRPRISRDRLTTSSEELLKVEIRRSGGLVFSAPLEALYWKGERNQIWPFVLIEYIVSALRVARVIYQDYLDPGNAVIADLLLSGLKDWILRPGTPDVWFSANRPRTFTEDDFVLAQPLVFRFEEIDSEPDRCGYRLVERVYEGFRIRREDIPKLFDAQSGRLVFPE
jgi:Putative DNA-binding domain